MFRPIPETTLFQRISYRLIVPVHLILALVESIMLVFSLEREKLLLRWFAEGSRASAESFYALWESRSDLIVETLLLFMVSVIGIAAQNILATVRRGWKRPFVYSTNGLLAEWHLLKLLGMAIFPDVLSGDRTGHDE